MRLSALCTFSYFSLDFFLKSQISQHTLFHEYTCYSYHKVVTFTKVHYCTYVLILSGVFIKLFTKGAFVYVHVVEISQNSVRVVKIAANVYKLV